jgi:hypothetical protein
MKAYFDGTSLHHSAGHPAFVGAAEGCDLLILILNKSKSKDRSLRQLLQGIGVG